MRPFLAFPIVFAAGLLPPHKPVSAMPLAGPVAGVDAKSGARVWSVQLNTGRTGGVSTGIGIGTGAPSALNPAGVNRGGISPGGPGAGLKPNSGSGKPNGSKPAPMRPNGVRKVN